MLSGGLSEAQSPAPMADAERGRHVAVTRGVSPAIARCELTFLERAPIDYPRAVTQHTAYEQLLEDLGLTVIRVDADDALPDCCFVEDIAIVLDEIAVLTRPGASSRRGETAAVAAALGAYRPIVRLDEPARIDGGDVLVLGRRLFVGLSNRTDAAGREALAEAVRPFDYEVVPVQMNGCLHLKTAVTAAADVLLVNPEWVDLAPLRGWERIDVAPGEPWAANVVAAGGAVVAAAGFPRTADRLRARGLDVRTVDVSEFQKAEGGVTCKSLLFDLAAETPPE
jgi:dimethylargininase